MPCPVRLKGFRTCVELIQHDRVGFVLWHEYLEFQGARLGCKGALGVSLQMLQIFIPLSRCRLHGAHNSKLAHVFVSCFDNQGYRQSESAGVDFLRSGRLDHQNSSTANQAWADADRACARQGDDSFETRTPVDRDYHFSTHGRSTISKAHVDRC